jgi:YHS domain-containing protein
MSSWMNICALSFVCGLSLCACQKKDAPSDPAATHAPVHGAAKPYAVGDKTHCPVTGEEFTVSASTVQVEHDGKHYAFCCADCAPAFTKNPAKYAAKN